MTTSERSGTVIRRVTGFSISLDSSVSVSLTDTADCDSAWPLQRLAMARRGAIRGEREPAAANPFPNAR
jgi:hypothetical protein